MVFAAMQRRLVGTVFLAYVLSLVIRCETKRSNVINQIPYALSYLFEEKRNSPVILYLSPIENRGNAMRSLDTRVSKDPKSDTSSSWSSSSEDDEPVLRTSENDERAYVLYHLLRTTLQAEDVEPSAAERIQQTQQILRKTFALRCRNLNKCIKTCPPIKLSCEVKCKQIFDDLDACGPPKKQKCKPSNNYCGEKRGTQRPSWLL